ncbi:MAG: DUF4190 domain-containing protein [Verrucomicrobiales bacterium]|jgi:competence protein ComGC|nr:DUF4190 domain-containing protein [Verrucomicrobiales bacterium]
MNDVASLSVNPPELPQSKKSGLAIVSFILGLLSPFCLFFISGIPAVICGHLALSKIKKSNGTLTGNGLAIAGLVLGYVSFVTLFFTSLLAGLAIPAINVALEQAKEVASMHNVQQIVTACHGYADKHDGKFPPNLEELVKEGLIEKKVLSSPLASHPDEIDYVYVNGLAVDSPGLSMLVYDRFSGRRGRAIGYVNGSAAVEKEIVFEHMLEPGKQ